MLPFVKKNEIRPPPSIKIGDSLPVKILSLQIEESKFKNSDGSTKQQLRFNVEDPKSGFKFPVWFPSYRSPIQGSHFALLSHTLADAMKREPQTAEDVVTLLGEFGRIFVRCHKFGEWNGQRYPRFKVIVDRLPPATTDVPTASPAEANQIVRFVKNQEMVLLQGVAYGPFKTEDIANLPSALADGLILIGICHPV